MERILFLDFDGVINVRKWDWYEGSYRCDFFHEQNFQVNHNQAIAWLNELNRIYPFSIVGITSWKAPDSMPQDIFLRNVLQNSGLDEKILVLGSVNQDLVRGDAIIYWLVEYGLFLDAPFVILDNDIPKVLNKRCQQALYAYRLLQGNFRVLLEDREHLLNPWHVKCNFEYGFLAPEFQKCKDIFATQEKKYEQKKLIKIL